jgi:hypothetical protein
MARASELITDTLVSPTAVGTSVVHIPNPPPTVMSPTEQAYAEMQAAYQHFNRWLFDDQLPHCLITFNRKGVCIYGYFSAARFGRIDGGPTTDEIALNPIHFKSLGLREAMQTLVHEMTYLWQHHFGTPGRARYHNKQWADRMIAIGLMPSDTGKPGGNTTGDHMADYPIKGGRFLAALAALESSGFQLTWYDRIIEMFLAAHPQPLPAPVMPIRTAASPSGKRVRFTCPGCAANAWGKASLNLICGDCNRTMQP